MCICFLCERVLKPGLLHRLKDGGGMGGGGKEDVIPKNGGEIESGGDVGGTGEHVRYLLALIPHVLKYRTYRVPYGTYRVPQVPYGTGTCF